MRFVLCITDDVVKRLPLNQTLLLWSAIYIILAMFCILLGFILRVYLAKISTEISTETSLYSASTFVLVFMVNAYLVCP